MGLTKCIIDFMVVLRKLPGGLPFKTSRSNCRRHRSGKARNFLSISGPKSAIVCIVTTFG